MIHKEAWYRESVRPIRIDDQEIARVTEKIWLELLKFLEGASKHRTLPSRKELWPPGQGPKIRVRNVQGKRISIFINVIPTHPDSGLAIQGYFTTTAPKELAISFPIGGQKVAKAKKFLLENQEAIKAEMAPVISHELTHAKDFYPHLAPSSEHVLMDEKKYFNDPFEVRAFMQQVARDTYDILSKAGDDPTYQNLNPSGRIQRVMGQSQLWTSLVPYLETENKKKIIRGVVNFLRDRDMV